MHPNSIKQPHRCSMVTSERPFKPSVVPNLSFNRRRRHIPVQSSRWKLSFLADHIGPEIDFHEFQVYEPLNNASRAKLYIRRSDTEVRMVSALHLGGILGVASVELGNGVG